MAGAFELLLILLFILLNGVFAMAEIAVVSARKARLQQRADEGDAGARVALELANRPGRFLSTVQVGITLIGTFAGAFGGATIAKGLAGALARIEPLAPYSEALAFLVVVLAITYLSLVLGELAPKRLALNDPEGIAARVARPMRALARLASPVVRLLSLSTEGVLRLLGARPSAEPPVTDEELTIIIAEGTQAGVFEEAEQDILSNVLRLDDWRVSRLMTPHTEVVWLDVDDPPEANWRKMSASGHAYFPLCVDDLDNVLGLVSVKGVWAEMVAGRPVDLRALATEALFVPENASALQVLDRFRLAGAHAALVIDEYGSVQGLVTLMDLMEAIVGDMPALGDLDEPTAVQRKDGSWLLDGLLRIDEMQDILGVAHLPDRAGYGFETVGGFVMTRLGRIPTAGDQFKWCGYTFEVVDMDGLRVDKVLVKSSAAGVAPPDCT